MSLTKRQYQISFWVLGLLLLLLANVFYLAAWQKTPPGRHYTGVNLFAAADKLVYYSMIEQGVKGRLMMKNLETAEPQKGLFFSPHWWLIGQTAKLFDLSPVTSYHLYRILGSLAFLLLLYFLLERLFKSAGSKLLASSLVLAAAGWGWWIVLWWPAILVDSAQLFNRLPVDLYVTEAFPFFNLNQAPLFIVSHLMILGVFYLYVKNRQSWQWQQEILTGLLAFLLILIHPYDIWILAPVLTVWSVIRFLRQPDWLIVKKLAFFGLFNLAAVIYLEASLFLEPAMSGWLKQNLVYSPPWDKYLIGFGGLLIGAVAAVIWQRRLLKQDPWWSLMAAWFLTIAVLLYFPVSYNRRFANALAIPLALLSSLVIIKLFGLLKQRAARMFFIVAAAVIFFFGSFYSLVIQLKVSDTLSQLPAEQNDYRFYLTDSWLDGLAKLKAAAPADSIILSNNVGGSSQEFLALWIPALTGRRVYLGHQHQAVDYLLKQQQLDEFWSSSNGLDRQAWLAANRISFIAAEPHNTQADYDWLEQADYLRPLFKAPDLLIYQVVTSS